jgi:hypothetical protein
MKLFLCLVSACLSTMGFAVAFAVDPALPPPAQREAMLREMAAQMERLDGEALWVRAKNRRLDFSAVVGSLAGEAYRANDWNGLLRAFRRLDYAYPNLHSSMKPGEWFKSAGRVKPELDFSAEWLAVGRTRFRLGNGDLLLAINGRPMEEWSAENLELCKWPLREQCDLELYPNFRSELLSWNREQPLVYTLERDGRPYQQKVGLKEWVSRPRPNAQCWEDEKLYQGFTMVHQGRFACLFAKDGDPGTVILRIGSFQYHRSDNDTHAIRSVRQEVDALWPWWREKALGIRHLIIDLADNGGGNQPVAYYQILFPGPFQEQWVRFKKVPELENEELRKRAIFWDSPQQENWFQDLLQNGAWASTPWGSLLPAVPMFCAGEENSNCLEGLFPVRDHSFMGRVTLLVNHWCVSSCDAFAYSVKDELGDRARVAGQPQAADTAYSRVVIQMQLDPTSPKGFRTLVENHMGGAKILALLTQSVSVGRSVDSQGQEVSGIPLPVGLFVPKTYVQDDRTWRAAAVEAIENTN